MVNLGKVFYNPFLLLLFSLLISALLAFAVDLGIGFIPEIFLLAFVIYLILSVLYNVCLVIAEIVSWRFFMVIPIIVLIAGLYAGIALGLRLEGNFFINFLFGLDIGGGLLFLMESVGFYLVNKTDRVITDNLSNYLIEKEKFIPHPLSQTKFRFRDFTANIIKLTGLTTKEMGAISATAVVLNPSKETAVGAAGGVLAARVAQKQFGHPRIYLFEVYVKNRGFEVNEVGWKYVGKSFHWGFDDKELREVVKKIDPEIEKEIPIIYFMKYPYIAEPLLRITFRTDYFENNAESVYSFITKLKKVLDERKT